MTRFRLRHPPRRSASQVRWRTVAAADLVDASGLIDELMADEYDGLTVSGVFPSYAAEAVCRGLDSYRSLATPVIFGSVLGRPLYQDAATGGVDAHLDDAERMIPIYRELFGFDPHDLLGEVLAPALGGRPWLAPTEAGRPYNPGNVRTMVPGSDGLPAHAGNQFLIAEADRAARHILTTTRAIDHMSYFVVLQPADEGGELSVFDRLWDPPGSAARGNDADGVTLGDDEDFDAVPCLRLSPGPGDLILFTAGHRWHRVEPIGAGRPRITYGGFAALSQDGREMHCWA